MATTTTRFALQCAHESAGTIALPPLCIGTWAWGDAGTWNHASPQALQDLEGAWTSLRANNLFFLDTAEVYGRGASERIIAQLRRSGGGGAATTTTTTTNNNNNNNHPVEESSESNHNNKNNDNDGFRDRLVVASKFLPIPWPPTRLFPASSWGMPSFCKASLKRLGMDRMDLYQVHGPTHFLNSIESMAGGLARCVELGLTRAVGVSNYSVDEMIRMDDALRKRGMRLASNQVEFSLLRTLPAKAQQQQQQQPGGQGRGSLLDECKKRGIVLLAYSPLGMGRLTGKYSSENPPPKGRRFGNVPMERLVPLLDKLREVAARHGVSCSAVALKWVIQKGAIPLGGVKNKLQAEENAKAASETWALTEEEMGELEGLALEGSTNWIWQHG